MSLIIPPFVTDLLLVLSKMNFNSLPNETVQRIVDLCHEADETYRKRKGEKAIIFPPRKPKRKGGNSGSSVGITGYAQWWGKSSSAVSLVNKTLRGMANKYVFTVREKPFSFRKITGEAYSLVDIDSSTLESSRRHLPVLDPRHTDRKLHPPPLLRSFRSKRLDEFRLSDLPSSSKLTFNHRTQYYFRCDTLFEFTSSRIDFLQRCNLSQESTRSSSPRSDR